MKYFGRESFAIRILYYLMSIGGLIFLSIVLSGVIQGECFGVRGRGIEVLNPKLVCYDENEPSAYYLYIAPYIALGLLLSSAAIPFIKKDLRAVITFFDEPPRRPKA